MRLVIATLAMLILPILLASYWPFRVSFDELVLLIAVSVADGLWHTTIIFLKMLLGLLVVFGLIALWNRLRS